MTLSAGKGLCRRELLVNSSSFQTMTCARDVFSGLHLLHLSWLALTLALASKGDCHTWLPVARTVLGPVPHLPVSVLCRRPHHPHSPQGICTLSLSLSLSATLLHKLLSPSTTLEGATGAIITLWCQIRQASYCGRAHSQQSLWRPET